MRWFYLTTAVVVAVFATAASLLGLVGVTDILNGDAFGKTKVAAPLLILLGVLSFRAAWALWRRSSTSAPQGSAR